MRYLFIGFTLLLAACNGSSYNDTALKDQLTQQAEEISALKQKVSDLSSLGDEHTAKFKEVQLKAVTGTDVTSNMMVRTLSVPVDFGPCADGGIKVGATYKNGASGLDELTQVFKQAPTASCPGVYAEYDVANGNLHMVNRIYYASSDCTGDGYIWDAAGLGIDRQKTVAGVAFISPNSEGEMWIAPGTQAQDIHINSAFIVNNGCGTDDETLTVWHAISTDAQTSGVPLSLGPDYQISGL